VGAQGRGESVWLAFFLFDVLTRFSSLARQRGDTVFADRCIAQAEQLRRQIEETAWDGEWYRRAYFDNGEPLGSRTNPECQIDSLSQSWSVLTGAGDPDRARQAMEAVDHRLVRRAARLIQLFDPPFATSHLNPGYVKGYVPGVRENGGQYTHAAVWTVMAFAQMGEHELAWELLGIINPVHHSSTAEQATIYKVEPYVIAADVYSVVPHVGRGGWTWYTGSAGWMYRLLTETLLGVKIEGETLLIEPRLPRAWPGFKIHYRFRETPYHIIVTASDDLQPDQVQISEGGRVWKGRGIPLIDDRQEHYIEVHVSRQPRSVLNGRAFTGSPSEPKPLVTG
jgi:cellobiose phosphorylase